MRQFQDHPFRLAAKPIEQIPFDPKCRDAITRVLWGLKNIYGDASLRHQIQQLLEDHFPIIGNPTTGRTGMPLWNILVLALFKMGL